MALFLRPVLKKLFQARERQDNELVKPFLDHLEDLRWTLVKMASALGLAMVLSFAFRFQLMHVVESPLMAVSNVPLRTLAPTDSINVSLTLAFYAGIILSFPLLLYFLAGFVLPALSSREKSFVLPAILVSFGLFLGGVFFCFGYVLPLTLRWLHNDAANMGFQAEWDGQHVLFVCLAICSDLWPVVRVAGRGDRPGEDWSVEGGDAAHHPGLRGYSNPVVFGVHRPLAGPDHAPHRRRSDAHTLRGVHLDSLVDGAARTSRRDAPDPKPINGAYGSGATGGASLASSSSSSSSSPSSVTPISCSMERRQGRDSHGLRKP